MFRVYLTIFLKAKKHVNKEINGYVDLMISYHESTDVGLYVLDELSHMFVLVEANAVGIY